MLSCAIFIIPSWASEQVQRVQQCSRHRTAASPCAIEGSGTYRQVNAYWFAGEELPVEEHPQAVTAQSQWQEVLGGPGGPDAAKAVKTGDVLGRFIGLKQIHSASQSPLVQVGPSLPWCERA